MPTKAACRAAVDQAWNNKESPAAIMPAPDQDRQASLPLRSGVNRTIPRIVAFVFSVMENKGPCTPSLGFVFLLFFRFCERLS